MEGREFIGSLKKKAFKLKFSLRRGGRGGSGGEMGWKEDREGQPSQKSKFSRRRGGEICDGEGWVLSKKRAGGDPWGRVRFSDGEGSGVN